MKKFMCIGLLLSGTCFAVENQFDSWARVRSISFHNYDMDNSKLDAVDFTSYRFQFGVKTLFDNKSSSYIQPRFAKTAGIRSVTDNNSSGLPNAETTELNLLDAHQAYLLHDFDFFKLKMGRQELNYGEHLIIGSLPWHDVGISFDGLKLSKDIWHGQLDIWAMTLAQPRTMGHIGNARAEAIRNHDFYGVYYNGRFDFVEELDIYYLIDQNLLSSGSSNKVNSTGIRIKESKKPIYLRTEMVSQQISNKGDHENAFQYDIEVGKKFKKFYVGLETSKASEHYHQMYPTAHKWLGYADLFRRQNIQQNSMHVRYVANELLTIHLSYHQFQTDNKNSSRHKWLYTASEDMTRDDLGSEVDLLVQYKAGKLDMELGYCRFMPGARFSDAGNGDPVNFSYLQMQLKY